MNKKAQVLKKYLLFFLLFSLIIVTFTVLPNEDEGFFERNKFTLPSNTLSRLNFNDNISTTISNIACDINAENNTCPAGQRSILQQGGDVINAIINNIVAGGFRATITIYKSLGLGKVLIEEVGMQFGLPAVITDIVVSMLFITILITILLLIFNRSDVG